MNASDLTKLVQEFLSSYGRERMIKGVSYYNNITDLDNKNFNIYYLDGEAHVNKSKSNEKTHTNYTKKVVEQAVSYISDISLKSDDKSYLEQLVLTLGKDFKKDVMDLHRKSRQQGIAGLYSYVNESGEFAYFPVNGHELIFVYDSSRERKLSYVVRIYRFDYVNNSGDVKEIWRAEVIDEQSTTFYQQDEEDQEFRMLVEGIEITKNPVWHWETINTLNEGLTVINDWQINPITEVKNNPSKQSDLEDIKGYIDAIEIVSSGFVNDLADVRQVLWAIKGYNGDDPAEAQKNIQAFSTILLDADEGSGIEAKTIEIPVTARTTLLEWLDKKVYEMSSSVNMNELRGGNLTNVLIKAYYTELQNKVELVELELRTAINNLVILATQYINKVKKTSYDPNKIEIIFKYDQIFNQVELVEMIMKSSGLGVVSKRTMMEKHPLVDDAVEEQKRLDAEKKEELASLGNDMGFGDE